MATTTEESGAPSGQPRVEPKWDQIEAIIAPNGELENAAKAQAESMSKIGNLYKRIEKDLHGNRAAVAQIVKLDKMSKDKRDDYIRTLEPLLVSRGYTLDKIDPEDLVGTTPPTPPSGGGGGGASADDAAPAAPAASNATGSEPLSEARAKLTGAKQVRGSQQLRKFLTSIRNGGLVGEAALNNGFSLAEAQSHVEADARGEYDDMGGLPARQKSDETRPKLGIVAGGKG